ncbi:sensor domain-containing phosphodiesterase [Aquipuribacter sp. SD81]|uniref:sensor domain-containing phosphodiesterase n=1 Tax=Aquipuribacter sp. SD81 TaxID=3127703 RepID=UPI003017E5DC
MAADLLAPEHIERRLREVLADPALAAQVLDVHLQPIVALPASVVAELEALVRWHDAELGHVPAELLVRVAERTRLVVGLGRWVLRRACAVAAGLPATGGVRPAVAVNVSPVQLEEAGFVGEVADALAAAGLPGDRLVLEVTESAGVEDLAVAHRALSAVRRLGVRTALDDFGTGRTSLTLLRDLPLDLVKIDRSFVSGARRGPGDGVLLRLLVDACHALGLEVVAEGVEDATQARTVTALGVDRGQGWHFGRPVPPEEAARALTDAVAPAPVEGAGTAHPDEFVLVSTREHRIVFASSGVFDVLGRLPTELAGRLVEEFVDAGDAPLLSDPADATTVPGERLLRVRHRDGTVRYLRSRTDLVEDEALGARVVSLCRDVTPVELARRHAREAEDVMTRAFDEAPCGMSVTGLDGRIRTVNRALAEVYGRPAEDVVGRHIDDLTHPDDRGADAVNLAEQREGHLEQVRVRKRALRPDGTAVPTEVVASLVRDADGAPSVIVAHVVVVDG